MVEHLVYTEVVGGSNPSAPTISMKIKEKTTEYYCAYGHRFIGKDVKLVPFRNQSKKILGSIILVLDPESEHPFVTGGMSEEGYLLACPVCGIIQLGGFKLFDDKVLEAKPTEPDRKLELAL